MARTTPATPLLLALILALLGAGSASAQSTSASDIAPGELLVKLSPEALPTITQRIQLTDLRVSQARQALQAAGATWGEKVFQDFFPADTLAAHRVTGEPVTLIDLSRWYTLHIPAQSDVVALARELSEVPGIEAAAPVLVGKTAGVPSVRPLLDPPDDELFESGQQWGLHNLQNPGRDIHALQAWEYNRGRSDVVVAVIDTGVDYNHPDLDPGDRSRVIAGFDVDPGDDPMDDGIFSEAGHGTSVAGVIGAITDNDLKAAGVMWDVQIMPVKVFTSSGVFKNAYVAQGIEHARANGADIVNISLEVPGPAWYQTSKPMMDASINAYRQGVAFFVSMGNDSTSEPQYPAGYPWVVAVGATDRNDQWVSTSNTGSHIDVAAPGLDHWSLARYNDVRSFGGTSCASPLTAGVGGLLLAESRDLGLGLTNDDLYWIIRHTADDVNASQHPGFDQFMGYGRVNAEEALALINPPNTVSQLSRTGGTVSLTQGAHTRNFLGGHYGPGQYLAAGAYHGVKQYRVTGHVSFSSPYQQTPLV